MGNLLTWMVQDIAPNYYDLDSFTKGPVKMALERTVQKIRRKEAYKSQGQGGKR